MNVKNPVRGSPTFMDALRDRISKANIKNANIVVIPPAPIPGIGQTAGFNFQIEQRNTNDDVHAFEKVVNNFVAEANKNPAISHAFSYYSAHTPSYNVTVDREKCKRMGVNISDVFTAIQTLYG
jgi:HAE1 family hydrophobic/amphiphilic exporter-1